MGVPEQTKKSGASGINDDVSHECPGQDESNPSPSFILHDW